MATKEELKQSILEAVKQIDLMPDTRGVRKALREIDRELWDRHAERRSSTDACKAGKSLKKLAYNS